MPNTEASVVEFRVAATTNVEALAGAVAHAIRRGDGVDLLARGLRQVGLAAVGVSLAREFLQEDGLGLTIDVQRVLLVFAPDAMAYGVKLALREGPLHGERLELQATATMR